MTKIEDIEDQLTAPEQRMLNALKAGETIWINDARFYYKLGNDQKLYCRTPGGTWAVSTRATYKGIEVAIYYWRESVWKIVE